MLSPLEISHRLDADHCHCRAIVETPASSRAKYRFDPDTGHYTLSGMLPAGMAFPLDFGFVPSTKGEDGDPVDILILGEDAMPLPVGCLVQVKLLGVIEAEQSETKDGEPKRNDRLIGRLSESQSFANVDKLDQLGAGFCKDLERFFVTYNELKGKRFRIRQIGDSRRAVELVEEASCLQPSAEAAKNGLHAAKPGRSTILV